MPLVEHPCPFCEGRPVAPDCAMCGGAGTLPDATPIVRAARDNREPTTEAGRQMVVRWASLATRDETAECVLAIEAEARASLDVARLARAIHTFNITVGSCDHDSGVPDCVDRAAEHEAEYRRG